MYGGVEVYVTSLQGVGGLSATSWRRTPIGSRIGWMLCRQDLSPLPGFEHSYLHL